jgi:hypothetical protein
MPHILFMTEGPDGRIIAVAQSVGRPPHSPSVDRLDRTGDPRTLCDAVAQSSAASRAALRTALA